jgi:hypothetical protein
MEKVTFTPEDDFNDEVAQFKQWLEQDQLVEKIVEMTDEELNLLTPDQKIEVIKKLYAVRRKLQDTIDWYESDEEESGHE